MEARGESQEGQLAVAYVLLNRKKDGRWGNSLTSVCLAPYQFSCWNTNDSNRKSMSKLGENDPGLFKMMFILETARDNPYKDPTKGATHYYAVNIPEPSWVQGAIYCGQFDNQKFYKDVK